MKKFISLGTECVDFLKATRASQGNFFAMMCILSVSFCFSLILYSTFFSLFRIADALSTANARVASLEAELEASQKAWDVATAAKAAAEKSAKVTAAKGKKAEKALADANQGRIQREEAITERLNRVSALASGKYISTLFIVCSLILLMVTYYPFCFCLQRKLGYLWRCCSRLMKILLWQR
jgi:biopolymer transport protein ExbB/TolQ